MSTGGWSGGLSVPVVILFGLAWHGRKRKRPRRRRKRVARSIGVAAGALLVCWPSWAWAQEVCGFCGMIDCPMDHTAPGADGVMVMGGISPWALVVGLVAVILFSFVATELLAPRMKAGWRFNLIRGRKAYAFVRSRWFQTVPQLLMVGLFLFLIYVGLFGSRLWNLTPVAVWTVWWAGLIIGVLFLGAAWCLVCPWDGLANLVSRLRAAARIEPLNLAIRWPAWLENSAPALFLFALLTWLELGFKVTTDPRATAYMGIGIAALAIGFALLFEGKKFCKHFCPVGRICGIYGNFAPLEIRARNPRSCATCTTEDCLHGNEKGYPCPTGLSLKTMTTATDCTMCTECIKSCNRHNVAINLRPFGADLANVKVPRADEAWLALLLLSLTLFHGFSMTSVWESFVPGEMSVIKWMQLHVSSSQILCFTLAMAIATAIPIALYWVSCVLSSRLTGRTVKTGQVFLAYAYPLLPIALFYHLAHNVMHLLMEGGQIGAFLSDPMGRDLGTKIVAHQQLVSDGTLWTIQVALIVIGHIFGVVLAHRASRRLFPGPGKPRPCPCYRCSRWSLHCRQPRCG